MENKKERSGMAGGHKSYSVRTQTTELHIAKASMALLRQGSKEAFMGLFLPCNWTWELAQPSL